jgi:hypothetical protein
MSSEEPLRTRTDDPWRWFGPLLLSAALGGGVGTRIVYGTETAVSSIPLLPLAFGAVVGISVAAAGYSVTVERYSERLLVGAATGVTAVVVLLFTTDVAFAGWLVGVAAGMVAMVGGGELVRLR